MTSEGIPDMRFLIVVPQFKSRRDIYYELPLGMMYISSALKASGFEVACLNLNHASDPIGTALRKVITSRRIDVLCTGGLSVHYPKIKAVLDAARAVKPGLVTVLGGGILTSEPELMLQALGADYGVTREGEVTIVELAKALAEGRDPGGIEGIVFRGGDGQVVVAPHRALIRDLDTLPMPDYEGFGVEQYLDNLLPNDAYHLFPFDRPRCLPLISSRGCPFGCTFCYQPLTKLYRQRSFDHFFRELDYVVKRLDLNMVSIIDELFSVNKARVREFCARIKPYHLKWLIQIKVNAIDEEIIQLLQDSGCHYISFGVESASDAVLKSMKKKITVAQIDSALALCRRHRIGIQANLIFGNRAETLETAGQSLAWWRKHKHYHVNIGMIAPYPGSPDYEDCVQRKIITDRLGYIEIGCPPLNMTAMPDADLAKVTTMMADHLNTHFQFCDLISVERTGWHAFKDTPLYEITVRCPQCAGVSTYRNIHQKDHVIFKLACKLCCQRFDLSANMFEHIRAEIEASRPSAVVPSGEDLAEAFAAWLARRPEGAATGVAILHQFIPDISRRRDWAVTKEVFAAVRDALLAAGVLEHIPSAEGNTLRLAGAAAAPAG